MKIFTSLVLVAFVSINCAKAQTTASRLVSWAGYIDYNVNDSAYYTYTGSNGGDLNHTLKFSNEILYAYNPNAGADSFAVYSTTLQSFDGSDNIIVNLNKYRQDSIFVNEWQTVYKYDANNNDTLATYQIWDTTKWLSQYRTRYDYINNQLDTVTNEDSIGGNWVGETRNIFSYNGADSLSNEVYQYWNDIKNRWYTVQQFTDYYNSLNYDTAQVYQDYDTTNQQWTNSVKYLYYYNASHFYDTVMVLNWVVNKWDTTSELFYSYDGNNNDTADIERGYNTGKWDTIERRSYTYNSYNQVTYYQFNGNPGFFFEPYIETRYHYEDYTTGINKVSVNNEQLSIYPNPTPGQFTINLTGNQNGNIVEVYNELGQMVFRSPLGDLGVKPTIDLTPQAPGLYFVEIKSANWVEVGKVFVTR